MKTKKVESDVIASDVTPETVICDAERDAKIAELAYYKAESRQFEPGHELEDWLTAEGEYSCL
ncbi:MAG: DUF2934 domain-containing protein [Methylococcales bacterium]|nr:DUF2934 domain-containing protein [Methylococcales bacterium]